MSQRRPQEAPAPRLPPNGELGPPRTRERGLGPTGRAAAVPGAHSPCCRARALSLSGPAGRTSACSGVSNVTERDPLRPFSQIRPLGKISTVPKETPTKPQDGGKGTVAPAKVSNTLASPVALATPSIRSDPEGLAHPAEHSARGHNLGKTGSYPGRGWSGSERGRN